MVYLHLEGKFTQSKGTADPMMPTKTGESRWSHQDDQAIKILLQLSLYLLQCNSNRERIWENIVQVQLFLCSETASLKCAFRDCPLAACKILNTMTHLWSQEKAVFFFL